MTASRWPSCHIWRGGSENVLACYMFPFLCIDKKMKTLPTQLAQPAGGLLAMRQNERMDGMKASASETLHSLDPGAFKYYPQCCTYYLLTKHSATPTTFLYMLDRQWQEGGISWRFLISVLLGHVTDDLTWSHLFFFITLCTVLIIYPTSRVE